MVEIDNLFSGGTYDVKSKCKNCGTKQLTKIKKGHIGKDVIGNGKCENCGCKMLEVIE